MEYARNNRVLIIRKREGLERDLVLSALIMFWTSVLVLLVEGATFVADNLVLMQDVLI